MLGSVVFCCILNAQYLLHHDDFYEKVSGIKDVVLMFTKPLNEYFKQHIDLRNMMLILCSTQIDVMTLVSFYRFIRYGTSWRFVLAMMVFYVFRSYVQRL